MEIPKNKLEELKIISESAKRPLEEITSMYNSFFAGLNTTITEPSRHNLSLMHVKKQTYIGAGGGSGGTQKYDVIPVSIPYPRLNNKGNLSTSILAFIRKSGTNNAWEISKIVAWGNGNKTAGFELGISQLAGMTVAQPFLFKELDLSKGKQDNYFFKEPIEKYTRIPIEIEKFRGLTEQIPDIQRLTITELPEHPSRRLSFTNKEGQTIEYTDKTDLRVIQAVMLRDNVFPRSDGTEGGNFIVTDMSSGEVVTVDEDGNITNPELAIWVDADLVGRINPDSICDWIGYVDVKDGQASMNLTGIVPYHLEPRKEESE